MNGSFLVESDTAVEVTTNRHKVKVGLAVVRLAGFVVISRGHEKESRAGLVPLDLNLVGLEEGLLRDGSGWGFR